MKTILVFEVIHDKPLPADAVELISNRAYSMLMNLGIKVDVKEHALPVVEMDDER